jgi:hypothetical protein
MIFDFGCQAMSHFYDVGICHILIGGSTEEGSLWIHNRHGIFDHLHI